MILTRIVVGTVLAAAAAGLLVGDRYLAPWFPVLFACLVLVGVVATRELVRLFPPVFRPYGTLAIGGALIIVAANWYGVVQPHLSASLPAATSPWELVLFAFVGVFAVAVLVEMYRYREPGAAVPRLGLMLFALAYLGLLGSFLAQLRWVHSDPVRTSWILAVTIFVPKAGDIGAFFTGTFLGKHKMTPILSPKKTWEGFTGGILAAMAAAVGLGAAGGLFAAGMMEAAAFGLVAGIAGVLGDLAESLIKRDCATKDASQSIPGFGGLLDVIDSVLFAAPVAYFWFRD
jgi:phosphatidate cytidylyltransferase